MCDFDKLVPFGWHKLPIAFSPWGLATWKVQCFSTLELDFVVCTAVNENDDRVYT